MRETVEQEYANVVEEMRHWYIDYFEGKCNHAMYCGGDTWQDLIALKERLANEGLERVANDYPKSKV